MTMKSHEYFVIDFEKNVNDFNTFLPYFCEVLTVQKHTLATIEFSREIFDCFELQWPT